MMTVQKITESEPSPPDVSSVRRELAVLITKALGLDVSPDAIDPDAPLYGEGLGLDSIDILEVALVISKEYGVQIKADSAENHVIFGSLNALSDYVVRHGTRERASR
jgi:acyl carrier protein